MALWLSDQTKNLVYLQGTALAGLQGAPQQNRSTEVRGRVWIYRFSIEVDTPNPMPGVAIGGGIQPDDSIIIALLDPTERIYLGRIFDVVAFGGGGATVEVGKINPNDSTQNDLTHYLDATAPVVGTIIDFNKNMTEQASSSGSLPSIPVDPIGDASTAPGFSALKIQVVLTVKAAAPDAGGILQGFLLTVTDD